MIRKEALAVLKANPLYSQKWESDYYITASNALKVAVRSLEAWDAVIQEISSLPIERGSGVFDCLHIIDRHLKEVEENE